MSVRVRIAPSPTGFAHLGTASTALYNILFARQNNGAFVLRLDDTDLERNRPEYEALIYESLTWLGLLWDEGPNNPGPYGPCRQSERVDVYREHAARLIAEGKAYRCYCTPDELEEFEGAVSPYGLRVLPAGSEYGNLLPIAIRKEARC